MTNKYSHHFFCCYYYCLSGYDLSRTETGSGLTKDLFLTSPEPTGTIEMLALWPVFHQLGGKSI